MNFMGKYTPEKKTITVFKIEATLDAAFGFLTSEIIRTPNAIIPSVIEITVGTNKNQLKSMLLSKNRTAQH